jgi:hypothetical protein
MLFELTGCAHIGAVPKDWFCFHAHSGEINQYFTGAYALKC